jgi:transposase
MYIATVPNRKSPPAILLRESFRQGSKVKTRTLCNLTQWKPERIEALRRALRGDFDGIGDNADPVSGPVFAVLFVLKQIADRLGLTRTLGKDRFGRLVLFLVLARVAHQGSRLSAVRWARDHAVAETLALSPFDEDDLYDALDWAAQQQEKIEERLYRKYVTKRGAPPALVLYDVTSSYLEGLRNELAAFGYDRDGKRGKKQIVIGLLTASDGEPLAVKVFQGNTSDPNTVAEQVKTLKDRFGIAEVVFVGDRGMVKASGKVSLSSAGFKYITALTDPQVRRLIKANVLQIGMFDHTIHEVEHGELRLVLRRNEATREKEERRREDKLCKLKERIDKRNSFVSQSKRADPEAGLRTTRTWARAHKLTAFVNLALEGREITVEIDQEAKADAALLDGCYVLETDVSRKTLEAKTVHDRYMDLQSVERDFRTMKTALLEVRPIFLRKAKRTCAHVFVAMLALKMVREMRRLLVAEYGTTDDDKMAFTLEDALRSLSRLCLQNHSIKDTTITRLPRPDVSQERILKALEVCLPGGVISGNV